MLGSDDPAGYSVCQACHLGKAVILERLATEGETWTCSRCDEEFERDIASYVDGDGLPMCSDCHEAYGDAVDDTYPGSCAP